MVDQIAAEESRRPPTQADLLLITETMTVNHILHLHPKARGIFRAFKVDCECDGLHCLDELYWRRGIDVTALLRQLNQSVMELE
jgi:iron-sulfur cluster repair protein YtfE (RIC family)